MGCIEIADNACCNLGYIWFRQGVEKKEKQALDRGGRSFKLQSKYYIIHYYFQSLFKEKMSNLFLVVRISWSVLIVIPALFHIVLSIMLPNSIEIQATVWYCYGIKDWSDKFSAESHCWRAFQQFSLYQIVKHWVGIGLDGMGLLKRKTRGTRRRRTGINTEMKSKPLFVVL